MIGLAVPWVIFPDQKLSWLMSVSSAIFGLFSIMMFIQHVYLILTGKSTLEAFATQDQSHREQRVLSRHFGWLDNSGKRKVVKQWREEWGGSQVDERWKAGSAMDMWRREMGNKWYEWICMSFHPPLALRERGIESKGCRGSVKLICSVPVGRPLGDGMHFPQNPRFGPNGEWLKKKDWPEGVQWRKENASNLLAILRCCISTCSMICMHDSSCWST